MSWKPIPRRIAWTLILANVVLWLIPSNIAWQIARDRHTVLGFYSLEKFAAQVGLLLLSLPVVFILFAPPERRRRRTFGVATILMVLLPSLVAIDLIARAVRNGRYVEDLTSYHRPPNYSSRTTFLDIPQAKRTYPNLAPGYPAIDCRFTCDARGFRNAQALEACDAVVIGDSFTEGSGVSDEHPWCVALAARTNLAIYNAGMSGGNTHDYLLNLENVGLKLRPRLAMVLLYEGNDFRGTGIASDRDERDDSVARSRIGLFFKTSPLVLAGRRFTENCLAPINANGWFPNAQALELMPLLIGPPGAQRPYTFDPKDMLLLNQTAEQFTGGRGFQDTRRAILEMASACRKQGVRLLIVYAPSKPHILLPLIPPERADKLHDFLSLVKRGLPPADQLRTLLLERAGVGEQAVADLCRGEGIEFVSLTGPLRDALQVGRQAYFSYDQHWTPEGHQVVADTLADYLRSRHLLSAAASGPAAGPGTQTAPTSGPAK